MHTFSPHGDDFCVFTNKANATTWTFNQINTASITYRSLHDWLVKNLNVQDKDSILRSRVVFGEGASFYASNGKTYVHHDLPKPLADEIDKRFKSDGVLPNILSLGTKNTYFARWPRETSSNTAAIWQFSEDCALCKQFSGPSLDFSNTAYIFLSPVDTTHYVCVRKSGITDYQVLDGTQTLGDHFLAYMQLRAMETGASFSLSFTSGTKAGNQQVTYISPETNYEMPTTDRKTTEKEKQQNPGEASPAAKRKSRFSLFGRKGEA